MPKSGDVVVVGRPSEKITIIRVALAACCEVPGSPYYRFVDPGRAVGSRLAFQRQFQPDLDAVGGAPLGERAERKLQGRKIARRRSVAAEMAREAVDADSGVWDRRAGPL